VTKTRHFHSARHPTPSLAAAADALSPPRLGCQPGLSLRPQAFSYARGAPLSSVRWGPTPSSPGSRLSLARAAALDFHFAWGPTPTRAAGAGSLSSRGPLALFTIRFVLDDELDDDPDDDEFGDDDEDGEGEDEDEDDEENDDEDPDTETWQVSSFRGPLKASFRLTSGGELPRLTRISQLI